MSGQAIDWAEIHRRQEAVRTTILQSGRPSREQTREVLKARAEALSREGRESALQRTTIEVVAFVLGQEKYGVETHHVREVYPLSDLIPLPGVPPFVLGIVSVRGRILSVLDIRKLFELPERGVSDLDRVIVLQDGTMELGLLANSILGVLPVPIEDLQPSLPTLAGLRAEYLRGVTPDRMAILDTAVLLADERVIVREEA